MNNVAATEHKFTNELINENSPYLLAHAHNPVNWYPWGEEALEKAKAENKPIFLSIGYAACHWCHVMERESFEDLEIAATLNEYFVSIKVDREQRPDLDEIYMAFTTTMTGHGGWPMSVFLMPDLKPFYAGTYFPPEDQYGRPGFRRLIRELAGAYRTNPESLTSSSDGVYQKLTRAVNRRHPASTLKKSMVTRSAQALMSNFDHTNGGFGSSPKFPHATELSIFLRHYNRSGDEAYLRAAEKALKGMAHGGIFDHVGGGFARYATDAKWLVPHFEKMLYDNGLLVPVYAEAYQITGDQFYLDVVRRTLDFVLHEMTDRSGGFYSSLDADSEGEEGKFYVWSKSEIEDVLGDRADKFIRYYNVTAHGNFERHNILNVTASSEKVVSEQASAADFDQYLTECRQLLKKARSRRIRPGTDDKILVSWNGLALSALATGYRVTGDQRYLDAAVTNATFVLEKLYLGDGLTHSYRKDRFSEGQFFEDYAYYIRGLLDLFESDPAGGRRWLAFAEELTEQAQTLFTDGAGHYYLRPADQSDLLFRPANETDGARPSPGSFMITNLLKLHRITEKKGYLTDAEQALQAVSGLIERAPGSMASAALALDYYLNDKIELIIVGNGPNRKKMLKEIYGRYLPGAIIAASPDGRNSGSPLFKGRESANGEVVAYLCRNSVCQLPVSTVKELTSQLDAL